ncbi:5'-nucleotidase SurE [Natronomonas pharaonis DSM 2160]|uniref:5'-nucleotidase SurE n=1 Tax=Natronomonas pharaonis (strain ATCC 35678 / DSM 2160 / CIP 103997 / JCM 8858 / NBRC 14720 / NCIMB 2260 / Gabara) TaxID=348780 RepID=SURE_NATPD|nr:5'/3'-nucleotidase SurE [Natronomonas pharaonis]Q3INV7.1 RecName: Full=5'-nucleotidase SurE; AltName: Full=Nucleoside 5'-monophosphate phosphohydrolase [Natronomonas pharaonis DSM 2160]CAI50195.1 5'-nucleotidase SurE [Natronomonas pharaonis DSM 2160]
MDVLLTNDDGIDAVGIRALYDALAEVADVTAVAPADDQSAVGRQLSRTVELHDHELGYAVEGTPADCVIAGLGALDLDPDIVVAGCNEGANLGEYVLGRSGTVSAAVEAAFFGVPAIAASVYFPAGDVTIEEFDPDKTDFAEASRAVRYLVDNAIGAGVFDAADYLNVNAPLPPETGHAPMEITEPSHVYEMDGERDGETVRIQDHIWERMAEGTIPDPPGTDRRAVVEGRVSVSPLTAPHPTTGHEGLAGLAEKYQ